MGLDRAMRKSLLGLIKRHEVQVLRRAGHTQSEVSQLTGVSLSEIRRIEAEQPVENYDDAAERRRRGIGRPSKAEPLRAFVIERLARDPKVSSLDLLHGAKIAGYLGSKSAFYALVARLRPEVTKSIGAIGQLPGDESQHGFGEVEVRFATGRQQRVHFFVSQLSYSRWSEASLVADRHMEPSSGTLRASAGSRSSRSSTATTRRRSRPTSRAEALGIPPSRRRS